MKPTVISIVIGNEVISLDTETLNVMLSAIDLTMSDGVLYNRYSDEDIDNANEARSLIEFALNDLAKEPHRPNLNPLAMSTTVT
jgi:hypothetical protein